MSLDEQEKIKALETEVKKLTRALEKERVFAERNKANEESKRLLADIVLAERSRLEHNMSLMLHHSNNIVIFFDANGIINFCADLFFLFKGLPPSFGLIKGKSLRELTEDFLPLSFINHAEKLLKSGEVDDPKNTTTDSHTHETTLQAFSYIEHEIRDYRANAVLLTDANGKKSGLMVQMYDMTENTRARREAEQANATKSDFLATVSHEIRTPMSAIIGLAEMLSKTNLDDKQQGYLSKIEVSSQVMLALINDLLDFSKIEANKFELVNDYFDMHALLGNLKAMFDVMMEQKHLHFKVEFDPKIPNVVFSDEKRIRQILMNILNNAYKYTPSGMVVFSVRPLDDDVIRFDVKDTGVGIKKEDFDKLFVAFEQLDKLQNKQISGTGLGLAITKILVEMMHGHIEVESEYGQGSTLTVFLPLTKGKQEDLPFTQKQAVQFSAPNAHVLVVDDVEINLEIAEFMLEPFNMKVKTACNGKEAIKLVGEHHFDIILMDHMMPEMDGIEATKHIRSLNDAQSNVPIIAFTANAIAGVEKKFIDAGFNSFLSKPIDPIQLSHTLYEFLPKDLIVD